MSESTGQSGIPPFSRTLDFPPLDVQANASTDRGRRIPNGIPAKAATCGGVRKFRQGPISIGGYHLPVPLHGLPVPPHGLPVPLHGRDNLKNKTRTGNSGRSTCPHLAADESAATPGGGDGKIIGKQAENDNEEISFTKVNRGDMIRTCDLLVPNGWFLRSPIYGFSRKTRHQRGKVYRIGAKSVALNGTYCRIIRPKSACFVHFSVVVFVHQSTRNSRSCGSRIASNLTRSFVSP